MSMERTIMVIQLAIAQQKLDKECKNTKGCGPCSKCTMVICAENPGNVLNK